MDIRAFQTEATPLLGKGASQNFRSRQPFHLPSRTLTGREPPSGP